MGLTEFRFCPLCKGTLRERVIDAHSRRVCDQCGWIDYHNPLPVAICAAINKKGKVLVVKRNQEPGKGTWALPGGFIESNEHPEKACLRELKEETGLDGKIIKLVGVYLRRTQLYGHLIAIGYAVRVLNEDIHINEELLDAKFVNSAELPHIPFLAHRKIIKDIVLK
jgi:ADP-ribose pyrophosphatase YjhB (NUDIX family)